MNSSPNTNFQDKVVYVDRLIDIIKEYKQKLTQYKQDICMGIWDTLCGPTGAGGGKDDSFDKEKPEILNIGQQLREKIFKIFKNGLAGPLVGFLCDYCAQTNKFTMNKTFFIYNLEKASSMDNSDLRKFIYK